jgi:hypothetical protein
VNRYGCFSSGEQWREGWVWPSEMWTSLPRMMVERPVRRSRSHRSLSFGHAMPAKDESRIKSVRVCSLQWSANVPTERLLVLSPCLARCWWACVRSPDHGVAASAILVQAPPEDAAAALRNTRCKLEALTVADARAGRLTAQRLWNSRGKVKCSDGPRLDERSEVERRGIDYQYSMTSNRTAQAQYLRNANNRLRERRK